MSHEDDLEDDALADVSPGVVAQAGMELKAQDVVLEPEPGIDLLDMDQVARYTQGVRVKVIKSISRNLSQIEDPAMMTAMLKAASDMDKMTVNRRRVGIEEEAAKTAEQSARDTAGLLRAIGSRMFQVPEGERVMRDIPVLPADIPLVETVPGETDAEPHQLSYDQFAKGFQREA